ncbi:lipopolysaccharide biosynthesis protein [Nocardioides lacusdianchii]|uniref:lipopolysaccharide biosynthesis protein n=1 Tax=Nocardioides lacusdianchii TaxID=2783664 RepID=UPI001CCA18BB|nr:lipopolysaccharide biosynthesis protein [Nocardioides lacusdianchii]
MTAEGGLVSRALRGGTITVFGQGARIALQILGLVILSRLLEPEAFGVVAIAQVFVTTGDVLRDLGLTPAAIQADTLSRQQQSNLFWLNVLLSTGLAAAGVAFATVADDIFRQSDLGLVLAALMPLFLLNAAQSSFQIDLIRRSRYTQLVLADVAGQAAGLVACCAAALAGWGYWALVAQALTVSGGALVLKGIFSRWLPVRPAKNAGTRPLVVYGVQLSAAQILSLVASNADTVALGYTARTADVGYYNRGYQLLNAPMQQLLGPLSNVAVPLLARARHDFPTYTTYLRRAQTLIAAPMAWFFMTCAALAGPIVGVVLGDGWERTGQVFQALAIGGAFQQLSFISFWAFLSLGLTHELVRYNVVTKLGTVVAIVVGAQGGLVGVAWAVTASLAVSWLINLWWLSRTAHLPSLQFLLSGGSFVVVATVTAAAARYIYDALASFQEHAALAAAVATSGGLYLGLLLAIPTVRRDVLPLVAILQRRFSRS